jgi:glycosyltransferase involved in cell wall biosynthesis
MNILWIAPYPVKPGQHPAPWILMLAREVAMAGHRLTILTPSPKTDRLQRMPTADGYEVIILPYKGGLAHLLSLFHTQIRAVEKYLEENTESYDMIHVHGTELQYASSLAHLGHRIPYIISIQGIMSLYKKELTRKLSKRYLYWTINSFYEKKEVRQSRHFFCRTDWDQQFVRSNNDQADITVCWEILRPEFFEYTHPFTGKDILFMGGDNPLKALEHALVVFNRLKAGTGEGLHGAPIDSRLHIVGYTNPAAVENIRSANNLSKIGGDDVILHGSLDAVAILNVYAACFCLYHPSLIDNSPDIAGHVRMLRHLYEDYPLQQWLGQNARVTARQRHDRKTIVDNTLHTYEKLMDVTYA